MILALEYWLALDGPRWQAWDHSDEDMRLESKKRQDDIAVHMDKLRRERELRDAQKEYGNRIRAQYATTKDTE
jgi:hypothetical protein